MINVHICASCSHLDQYHKQTNTEFLSTDPYVCTIPGCGCKGYVKTDPAFAPKAEAVNHPSHYGGDTVYEAIKVIEAWSLGFHLGNAVKYISRAGKKDPAKEIEDLEKAAWYLNRRIEQLKVK